MAFSGGVFSLIAGNPVTTNTTISSSWANNTLNDLAVNGLSMCMLKDGSQTMTGNLPMAAFKITGLGAGTALTDAASITNSQNGFGSFLTSVAGTNTITGTATPTPAYTVGQRFTFVPAATNTGAATLNISSLGGGAVQLGGAALRGGELMIGCAVTVYVTAATPVFEIVSGLGTLIGATASTFTFDGSGGTSASKTLTWQKIGNWVTLNIPTTTATTGTNSTVLQSNTALPAAIRPTINQDCVYMQVSDNATAVAAAGLCIINTAGLVALFRDGTGTATFTNTSTCGLGAPASVTYFIG